MNNNAFTTSTKYQPWVQDVVSLVHQMSMYSL